MSEHDDQIPAAGGPDGAPAKRAGHVDVSASRNEPGMDPANRSLIEAMRITYRLLMTGMVALLGVYVLSGLQPIDEGERGVRTLFGEISDTSLDSGIQFAFPPPFGEIIRVPTGAETILIDATFFPDVPERDANKTIEELAQGARGARSLDPADDGAMVTADGNLAHARWSVTFRREVPTDLITSVEDRFVRDLIRASVERAIVRVMAETTIDDLLKQSSGQAGSVVNRVRDIAQARLDELDIDGTAGVGVVIERIDLLDKTPPLFLYGDFAAVQSAQSEANQLVETARSEAETVLNSVAGRAAGPLVSLIDEYERAIELNADGASDADGFGEGRFGEDASQVLSQIRGVLLGDPVEIRRESAETQVIPASFVSGEVTSILDGAASEADSLVTRARADDASFRARLAQLDQNPLVVKQRAWADAIAALLTDETIETIIVPPGTSLVEMMLNQDPQIKRDRERAMKQQEVIDARTEQREEFERQQAQQLRSSNPEVQQ